MALRHAGPATVPLPRGRVRALDGRETVYYAVELPHPVPPRDAYVAVQDGAWPLLLESAAGLPDIAERSMLVVNPSATFVAHEPDRLLERLHRWWATETGRCAGEIPAPGPGVYGLLTYEAARGIERLPCTTVDDMGLPIALFGRYDAAAVWDHRRGDSCIVWGRSSHGPAHAARLMNPLLEAVRFGGAYARPVRPSVPTIRTSHEWSAYASMVERARAYIRAGDIFQANLAQRLAVPWCADAWSLYERLMQVNPSPFSVLADFGEWAVVSCSPERLVRVAGDRIETRPLAGTRPRGRSLAEDAALRRELRVDPKECAEHIMIVDMARNDIGRVCTLGSVRPASLAHLESYSHVSHIASNIVGRLRRGVGPWEVIRAVFPGASITGVPKVRCMEIIDELEPVRRGAYTGAFGWIAPTGDCDWNILIRTITLCGGQAYAHVGGGIVADSDARQEYAETWAKAAALLAALGVPSTAPAAMASAS